MIVHDVDAGLFLVIFQARAVFVVVNVNQIWLNGAENVNFFFYESLREFDIF